MLWAYAEQTASEILYYIRCLRVLSAVWPAYSNPRYMPSIHARYDNSVKAEEKTAEQLVKNTIDYGSNWGLH